MVPRCARTGQVVEYADRPVVRGHDKVGPGPTGKNDRAEKAIDAVASGEVKFVPRTGSTPTTSG